MNNYTTKYEGATIGLIKAIKIKSLSEFFDIEVDIADDASYIQIDSTDKGAINKNKQTDPLGVLFIKVGDVELCKYTIAGIVEYGYHELLPELYSTLFERDANLVHEVLTYLIDKYKDKPESLLPVTPYDPYKRKEPIQYNFDTLKCFTNGENLIWNNTSLVPMLENYKLLNDALSSEKNFFQLANLLEQLQAGSDYEDFKQFKSEIIDFLIKYDYKLDADVAAHFLCLCQNDEKVYELFNHLAAKTPELSESMSQYLTTRFSTNNNQGLDIDTIATEAKNHDELSLLDNTQFAKFILEKDVFKENVDTSLESLAKAHFMFLANDRKNFDQSLLMNIKPGSNLTEYLNFLNYEDKKLFITAISENKEVHDSINITYCGILEELLFDREMRNFGIGYHLYQNYNNNEKKEHLKDIMNTLATLPFNFQEKVKEILEVKLSNMNEIQEKQYFDIMTIKNEKVVNRVKI